MPQTMLSRHEIEQLPMGNQHTKWNVIRWQVVKGAARQYGVRDWLSVADSSLTYEENVELMRLRSTQPSIGGPTMRELTHII